MVSFYPFSSVHYREDVVLAEDHVLDAVELHFGSGVLAEEDAVAVLNSDGAHLPGLEHLAVPHGHHDAFDGLFLGRIRDDDAAFGLLLLLQALDYEAVGERTNLHGTGDLRSAPRPHPLPRTREPSFGTHLV